MKTIPNAYIFRPAGYKGANDAWYCMECGEVRKTSDELMQPHVITGQNDYCNGGFARGLVLYERRDN